MFLNGRSARTTLWLDRGELRRQEQAVSSRFRGLARCKTWEAEDLARHKLDRKIKAEARNGRSKGISALAGESATMGRLRALKAMREDATRPMIRREGHRGACARKRPGKSGRNGSSRRLVSRRSYGGPARLSRDFSLKINARRPGGTRGSERGRQDHASEHADRQAGARYRHGQARRQSRRWRCSTSSASALDPDMSALGKR